MADPMPVPEVPPMGAAGGGIPAKVAGIPTIAIALGAGALVLVIVYVRTRGSSTGTGETSIPAIITPTQVITGDTTTTTPTTPTTPAQGAFTQASIIANWITAQTALADLTDDAQKKLNRLGGSWLDISGFLITHPEIFGEAGNAIRYGFTQIPAGYYGWISHISTLYAQAKNMLVEETHQGYFLYSTLPQLVEFLRANPVFITEHPEYKELIALPVTAPANVDTTVPATG